MYYVKQKSRTHTSDLFLTNFRVVLVPFLSTRRVRKEIFVMERYKFAVRKNK